MLNAPSLIFDFYLAWFTSLFMKNNYIILKEIIMNELIGASWFFIVAFIAGLFIWIGMEIVPRISNYIKQFIRWRKFIKSEYDYEYYED